MAEFVIPKGREQSALDECSSRSRQKKCMDENQLTIFVSHHIYVPDSADAIDDVRMAKMVVKMMKDEALKLL